MFSFPYGETRHEVFPDFGQSACSRGADRLRSTHGRDESAGGSQYASDAEVRHRRGDPAGKQHAVDVVHDDHDELAVVFLVDHDQLAVRIDHDDVAGAFGHHEV